MSGEVLPGAVTALRQEIEELRADLARANEHIEADEKILGAWSEVLDALSCDLHGRCVPHALEKIQELKTGCSPKEPIPMLLWCPGCGSRHIDVDEFATKVHHTHACQDCGHVWRPAVVPTVGVQFLPGFKNKP